MNENKAILAPWYFKKDFPNLKKTGYNLLWKSIDGYENCEIYGLGLFDNNKNCYGLIKQGTYLLPIHEGEKFIIWSRSLSDNRLSLSIYKSQDLEKISISKESRKLINDKKTYYWFNSKSISTLNITIDPAILERRIDIPNEFSVIQEILLLTEIEGLYIDIPEGNYWHNTAMIRLDLKEGMYTIYPQDHFNKSNADFTYVWMTQVQRVGKKGQIKVNGIRMDDFYLDKTHRNRKNKLSNWL